MSNAKTIDVYADWEGPVQIGILSAQPVKGREVFSFTYDPAWIEKGLSLILDPVICFQLMCDRNSGKAVVRVQLQILVYLALAYGNESANISASFFLRAMG